MGGGGGGRGVGPAVHGRRLSPPAPPGLLCPPPTDLPFADPGSPPAPRRSCPAFSVLSPVISRTPRRPLFIWCLWPFSARPRGLPRAAWMTTHSWGLKQETGAPSELWSQQVQGPSGGFLLPLPASGDARCPWASGPSLRLHGPGLSPPRVSVSSHADAGRAGWDPPDAHHTFKCPVPTYGHAPGPQDTMQPTAK